MSQVDPLAPPPFPPVRRLTRTVWIAAALLLCGTVFLIVYLAAPRAAPAPTRAAPLLAPSDPTFLQHPSGELPPDVVAEREALRGLLAQQTVAGEVARGTSLAPPTTPALQRPETSRDSRREAYLRALNAPLLRVTPAAPEREDAGWNRFLAAMAPAPAAGGMSPASTATMPGAAATPSVASGAAAGAPGLAPLPPRSEAGRPNPPEALATAQRSLSTSFRGGPTIAAGTVIPALLLTAVNSDLPGQLIAQVSRNVYDSRQQTLLIPQASRLLGRYEDQVSLAQSRLLVAWNRLILPSGEEIVLGGLNGTDPSGAAGLPAETNRHVLRVVGDALLLSILSAGAQLSQPQSASFATAPSAGNVAAGALGQELTAAGLQLLEKQSGTLPTLRLPAGTPLLVFVQNDLELAPSLRGGADGRR